MTVAASDQSEFPTRMFFFLARLQISADALYASISVRLSLSGTVYRESYFIHIILFYSFLCKIK